MVRPHTLNPKPALELALLGGVVAALLFSALIYLAPLLGDPLIDIPHLIGGLFTTQAGIAFWLGFWIHFLMGVFLFPPLLSSLWNTLPGNAVSIGGAALKGALWGGALWLIMGVLLPILGMFNRLPARELANPGFFALDLGILAAVALLVAHLAYGLALALVANMGQDISPLDTLGWPGYRHAETYEMYHSHRQGSQE
jgi:hypothetical protein